MANNYTTFAEAIEMPREAACYAAALDCLCSTIAEEAGDFRPPERVVVGRGLSVPTGPRMIADAQAIGLADWYYGTGASFEVTECGLYISSEESLGAGTAGLDVVVAILQAAMARFDLPGAISIQWAYTCSKLRAGEFGGGAVVITKDEERWLATNSWVQEQIKQLGASVPQRFDPAAEDQRHVTEGA